MALLCGVRRVRVFEEAPFFAMWMDDQQVQSMFQVNYFLPGNVISTRLLASGGGTPLRIALRWQGRRCS